MATKSVIDKIYQDKLCLGCGLCETVCGRENVEMQLQEEGFFRPVVKNSDVTGEDIIKRICPGLNIENDLYDEQKSIWGKIDGLYTGFSTDKDIRTRGSSGGIVSGVAVYMLEQKLVDGVLQVGGDSQDYERNVLQVSYNKEDVLRCASSRYAPALIFDKIIEILERDTQTYCFIGKPCDISALKNFLNEFPIYKDRFKLTVSIMCAGLPSFNGTKEIIEELGAVKPVTNLVYRGNGWPGFFSFLDSKGIDYRKSYNDSWGKTLNRHLNFRCKVCPDGIGLQADIAVGDAWETKDGYPDFSEKEGQSLVIVRSSIGMGLIKDSGDKGLMSFQPLSEEKIGLMQPYQFNRRKRVGARVLAVLLVKRRLLNYQNVQILSNMKMEKFSVLVREFLGTFKRLLRG